MGDDAWPSTPSEIVGWEMGARTCLHVRPGRLTILECRFNKTRHHLQSQNSVVASRIIYASGPQKPAHTHTHNHTHTHTITHTHAKSASCRHRRPSRPRSLVVAPSLSTLIYPTHADDDAAMRILDGAVDLLKRRLWVGFIRNPMGKAGFRCSVVFDFK